MQPEEGYSATDRSSVATLADPIGLFKKAAQDTRLGWSVWQTGVDETVVDEELLELLASNGNAWEELA